MAFVCNVCGYEYSEDEFDGVTFEAQSDDFTCPVCGVDKSNFS